MKFNYFQRFVILIFFTIIIGGTTNADQCEEVELENQLNVGEQEMLKKCIDSGSSYVSLVPFIVVGNYTNIIKNRVPVVMIVNATEMKITWISTPSEEYEFAESNVRATPFQITMKFVKRFYKFVRGAWNQAAQQASGLFSRKSDAAAAEAVVLHE